jgi:serine/threonine protein kinase
MPVTLQCPNPACGHSADVAEERLGHVVRCTRCGQTFTLVAAAPAARPDGTPPTLAPRGRETVGPRAAHSAPGAVGRPGAAALPQQVGCFQLRALLGAGAFGKVYRAYDPQLDRDVAHKLRLPGTLDDPRAAEPFLREAKAAARLRHPHIVPVYDAGRDGSHYYIASAFIEGRTLAGAISERVLDVRRAAQVVRDLAEALAYAHDMGIVHRDVKAANVLLDASRPVHTTVSTAFRPRPRTRAHSD